MGEISSSARPGAGWRVKADVAERPHKAGRHLIQLASVVASEPLENFATFTRDSQNRASPVLIVSGTVEQAFALGAIDEFDRAVVLEAEARSRIRNGYDRVVWGSRNLQEQLMLLRLQTRCVRS